MNMNDNFRHKGLRLKLVNLLRDKGIIDENVLMAISKIPRHLFLDKAFLKFAYQDKAFPIGANQTISNPYTVAYQTELLKLKAKDKVLEIGTGSGYQAVLLSKLVRRVYTIERKSILAKEASKLISKLNISNVITIKGDGALGLPIQSPFDKILITAAAEEIPKILLNQLKTGGIMVLPIGPINEYQILTRVTKRVDSFECEELDRVKFVPLLPNTE